MVRKSDGGWSLGGMGVAGNAYLSIVCMLLITIHHSYAVSDNSYYVN